jgi:transcriptional regulator GlxA family with amidase domain
VQRMHPEDRFGIRNAKLGFVISRMEAGLADPIPIADLAQSVDLSTRHLERLFLTHLNQSPSRFYIHLRMTKARDLLLRTALTVVEIAQLCGYESPSHFSRSYRQFFRESPVATRRSEPATAAKTRGVA